MERFCIRSVSILPDTLHQIGIFRESIFRGLHGAEAYHVRAEHDDIANVAAALALERGFFPGWFAIVGELIIAYTIWLLLLDKNKTTQLLLIGSLVAVAYTLTSMVLVDQLGMIEFKIRLVPLHSPVFISSITLSPIIVMLAQQYTSSWKGYMAWSGSGFAIFCFILAPVLMYAGVAQMHHWNLFYHFLSLFGLSLIVGLVYLWFAGTQARHSGIPAVK